MKTTTCISLLGLVAAAVAAPLASGSCSSPGALVCNGKGQFGICDINMQAVWLGVAQGTECVCSGASCSIAAAGADAPAQQPSDVPGPTQQPAAQPTAETPAPAASSQAAVPDVAPEVAAPPAVTPAASPAASSASAPATQSSAAADPNPLVQHGTTNTQSGSSSDSQASGDASNTSYRKNFSGNGSPTQGWPAENQWVNFDSMWDENLKNVISKSCSGFGASPDNSDQESADLKSAIQSVSQQSGVDSRYILAIVMQESNGCVRVPTTNYGVNNPGLMQSHNGPHSCAGKTPCPSSEITGMIQDGVMGTPDGDGLKQLLAKAGGNDVQSFYMAARMYNSGSIASSGLLQDGIATHCYVTDVANRLLGWSAGASSCAF